MDDYSLWLRTVATETRSWVAHVYDRKREKNLVAKQLIMLSASEIFSTISCSVIHMLD